MSLTRSRHTGLRMTNSLHFLLHDEKLLQTVFEISTVREPVHENIVQEQHLLVAPTARDAHGQTEC